MDYWESILQEVKHRDDEQFRFRFTDLGEHIVKERSRVKRRERRQNPKAHSTVQPAYYLGEPFDQIYLTRREAETCHHLLRGKTIPETGLALNLSPRTIEFYVKNMKLKIGVKTKDELVATLRGTVLLKTLLNLF